MSSISFSVVNWEVKLGMTIVVLYNMFSGLVGRAVRCEKPLDAAHFQ